MLDIHCGDCLDILRTLPDQSIHCIVTSPPYYSLRDYGTATWDGGDPTCTHISDGRWYSEMTAARDSAGAFSTAGPDNAQRLKTGRWRERGTCTKCGALYIDQQLGQERTPTEYVEQLVAVFQEIKRVLRDDGTVWLNIGDSYSAGGREGSRPGNKQFTNKGSARPPFRCESVPPKNLLMMPARVALALQADGWYLRSDIIWQKGSCMPESVKDRPTQSHEHVFLLSKSPRYFYDSVAIAEPAVTGATGSSFTKGKTGHTQGNRCSKKARTDHPTRNARNVWTINPRPFRDAHFATMPPDLATRCILAGTSQRGCCPTCGAPWQRVFAPRPKGKSWNPDHSVALTQGHLRRDGGGATWATYEPPETIDWEPSCDCRDRSNTYDWIAGRGGNASGIRSLSGATYQKRSEPTGEWQSMCACDQQPIPCTVLDPFAGAGTTGLAALKNGRAAILIELNRDYVAMMRKRLKPYDLPTTWCAYGDRDRHNSGESPHPLSPPPPHPS